MTSWTHSVSWSKVKLALQCHLALQKTINKEPYSYFTFNYYQELGKLVQWAFEKYFLSGVNLKPGGTDPIVLERVFDRVVQSAHFNQLQISYPMNSKLDEQTFIADARKQFLQGADIMRKRNLLGKPLRPEVKWNATFRGFRMFGMLDFIYETPAGVYLFDGKGSKVWDDQGKWVKEREADPNQLLYYALAITATNRKVLDGGFLYWQHDFVRVDLSEASLLRFVNEILDPKVIPVFRQLTVGVEGDLPASPSKENCKYCGWRLSCEASVYRNEPVDHNQPEMLSL